MRLSAIAATLRRKKAPPKDTRPSTPAINLTSLFQSALPTSIRSARQTPSSPRKPRFKDTSATDIVDKLADVDQLLPDQHVDALAAHVTAHPDAFSEFVTLATQSGKSSGSPRERNKRAWVVTTLFRHGPAVLRATLATRPDLIRQLVTVFDVLEDWLDPALASYVADLLSLLLYEYPKETSTALFHTDVVSRLVAHISLQPAVDLLPRFVGSRVFTSLNPAPLLPAHKRSIAIMGKAKVQTLLAERCLDAAKDVLKGKKDAMRVYQGCCLAMAEISDRALCVPKKYEDHDERTDVGFAGNLLIVPAHVFNDAKDHMSLIQSPTPLLEILSFALEHGEHHVDLILLALEMTSTVLRGLRSTRSSLLPTMRRAVAREDAKHLGQGLIGLQTQLETVLGEKGRLLGRKRMAVLDLLREVCATLDEDCVGRLLDADKCRLPQLLLNLVVRFRRNDMLLGRVSQILTSVFDHCQELTAKMLRETDVVDVLLELKKEAALHTAVASLISCQAMDNISRHEEEKLWTQLNALEKYFDEQVKEQMHLGLEKGPLFDQHKVSEEMGNSINLEEELSTSEDYRHDVYIQGIISDLTRGETEPPPTESIVGHGTHAGRDISKVWNKGLTKLMTHAYVGNHHGQVGHGAGKG